jgi:hypothetical protein
LLLWNTAIRSSINGMIQSIDEHQASHAGQ